MHKVLACLALLLFPFSAAFAQLNAYFVNVGQGDAIYLELPNGSNVLIDGGPAGKPIVDFLKSKNVTKLDHVVFTHPHSDHYMGLLKVLENFQVNNFYDTKIDNTDAGGDDSLRKMAAAEPGCKVSYPEAGDQLPWDKNVTVKVFNSCSAPVSSANNTVLNNCSIVMRLYYNGHGILLMGDAESEVENAIMRVFKSGLNSTYLKVGHHGSRYSTSAKFLERVQPKVAVLSVGQDNNFGHPHKELMDRLKAANTQIFSTVFGTQSLVIPAPKRGMQLLVNGVPEFGGLAADQSAAEFNMEERVETGVESEALQQLRQQAR
ncbi:MAG: MBL fold metallo-hydrolase [Elusimicrobiales bacterium]|nr:MBL fold metallo-hydrolase [Elusimicrobiales bacterium]